MVIMPVTINGLVMARENSMPLDWYVMIKVEMKTAGKAENMPPKIGPATLLMNITKAIITPLKAARHRI